MQHDLIAGLIGLTHNTLVCSPRLVYSASKVFASDALCKPSSSDSLFRSRGYPDASPARLD